MTIRNLQPLVKAKLIGNRLYVLSQNNLVIIAAYLIMAKLFGLPKSYSFFMISFFINFGLFQGINLWKSKQKSVQQMTEQLINLNINQDEAQILFGKCFPDPEIKEDFIMEQSKLLKRNPDNYAAQLLLLRRYGCERFSA
jgi:hypothetical protein